MAMTQWMSWEGGVDLVAMTLPGLEMPNVIVHVIPQVGITGGPCAVSAPCGLYAR
jgi:hypothetical protein